MPNNLHREAVRICNSWNEIQKARTGDVNPLDPKRGKCRIQSLSAGFRWSVFQSDIALVAIRDEPIEATGKIDVA